MSATPSVSDYGQTVTITATVTGVSTALVPSGMIQFMDGSTGIGGGSLDANGQATFTTTTLSVGDHSITAIYGGDGNYLSNTSAAASEVVHFAVTNPGPQNNIEGDAVSLQIVVPGTSNIPLTFSAANLPMGLAISSNTGLITGTVTPGAATGGDDGFDGYYTTAISATDGTYTSTATVAWTIAPRISLKVVDAQQNVVTAPQNIEGDVVNLQAIASTPDNTSLTFSAQNLPAGLSINSTSGAITGTILAYAATNGDNGVDGNYSTIISVTDGNNTTSETLNWSVLSPISLTVIDSLQNVVTFQKNIEGDTINLEAVAVSPTGGAITYSASNLPAWLKFDPNTRAITTIDPITGNPGTIPPGAAGAGFNQNGDYTIVFTASNATTSASVILSLRVLPCISLSVVDASGNSVVETSNIEGDHPGIRAIATSPDTTPLTYSAQNLPTGLGIDSVTGAITGTIATGAAGAGNNFDGSYTSTITVSDNKFSASVSLLWSVFANAPTAAQPRVTVKRASVGDFATEVVAKNNQVIIGMYNFVFKLDLAKVPANQKDRVGLSDLRVDPATKLFTYGAAVGFVRFNAANVPAGEYVLQTIKKTDKFSAGDGTVLETIITYTSEGFSVDNNGQTSIDFHMAGSAELGKMVGNKKVAKIEQTMEFTVGLGHYEVGGAKLEAPIGGFQSYGTDKADNSLWGNLKFVPNTQKTYSVTALLEPGQFKFSDTSTNLTWNAPALPPPLVGDLFPDEK